MTIAPVQLESTNDEPLGPPRRRRWIRLIVLAVVALVVAAGTAFLIKVGTERAIGTGDEAGARGSGLVQYPDPFLDADDPFGRWASVDYQPGHSITIGTSFQNLSHTQSITVTSLVFGRGSDYPRLFSAESVAYTLNEGTADHPFHPFTVGPRQYVYVEWTLTMCSTGVASKNGGSTGVSDYRIGYRYFGFTKHQTVSLMIPVEFDHVLNMCQDPNA